MKIEICNICEGSGVVEGEDERGFDSELCKCVRCDGSGRLITGNLRYVVPFTKNRSDIYKAEKGMFDAIRELEKR